MLQLWTLALLCGLLTGTSASLLNDLGNDLSDVLNVVESGIEDQVDGALHTVDSVLNELQNSNIWQEIAHTVSDAQKLIDSTASSLLKNLNILKVSVSKIQLDLTSDGEGFNLKVPLNADVSLQLPVIGNLVELSVALNLQTDVKIVNDPETRSTSLAVGQCFNNVGDIQVTLLNRQSMFVNRILNNVLDSLKNTVSSVLQDVVCPLLNDLLGSLNLNVVESLLTELAAGALLLDVNV